MTDLEKGPSIRCRITSCGLRSDPDEGTSGAVLLMEEESPGSKE